MNLYEKILEVRKEYGSGVVEFLKEAPISSGLYYDIKEGLKTSLNPKQAHDMHKAFPKFEKEWFMEVDIDTEELKSEKIINSVNELDAFVKKIIERDETLMQESIIYRNFIEGKVTKELLKIASSKESFLDFLNK